jgi:hypothetical protein
MDREAQQAQEAQEAARFQPNDRRQNPGGKPKAVVNPNSGSPQERDAAEMHARSTAGRLASEVGISRHKASQAIAVTRAAETNPERSRYWAKYGLVGLSSMAAGPPRRMRPASPCSTVGPVRGAAPSPAP